MMTKKNFEAIAADIHTALGEAGNEAERWGVRTVANRLAVTFALQNPRFDQAKFLTACGI